MKKEDLPQDDSALKKVTRELMYVKDNDGKYTTDLSTGWEVKKTALDNAWDDIKERSEDARLAVKNGKKSPICYFMEVKIMDLAILSLAMFLVKRDYRYARFVQITGKLTSCLKRSKQYDMVVCRVMEAQTQLIIKKFNQEIMTCRCLE